MVIDLQEEDDDVWELTDAAPTCVSMRSQGRQGAGATTSHLICPLLIQAMHCVVCQLHWCAASHRFHTAALLLHSFQSVPAYGFQYESAALQQCWAAFTREQRADICEGGVWFRRCLSRLGFPHGELRTCHQTHPHHNGLPVRSAAFHWAGAYSHYSLGLRCHTHLLQLLPHNIARKIPSIASAIQYDGAQYVCNNASMTMELLGKLQWFGHRRCLPHTSSVIG